MSNDGYVPWGGNFYPVPMHLALKSVLVESVFGRMIHVYDEKGNVAITHDLSLIPGHRPFHPEHEEMNRAEGGEELGHCEGLQRGLPRTQRLYGGLEKGPRCQPLCPSQRDRLLHGSLSCGGGSKNRGHTVKRLLASKALKVPALPLSGGFVGPAPLARNLAVYREVIHE